MGDEGFKVDRSDAADARRFRWLLAGNGYFLEEAMLRGPGRHSSDEQDRARIEIDEEMASREIKSRLRP